ncbi:MAG: thiamine pyrophosphate-binding protein [Saprospiraceae bacterium]
MNVAELFVQCLEKEGVTKIFGVPGEENEDILFAIADSKKIEFIPCRHEQGAAFIANVWGRLSGKAGVCLATLGPGATNLITGIADANLDKSPVVVITAQGDLSRLHHESHQLLDIVSMFKPITKWNVAVKDSEVVPEVIRKAFKIAQLEKPGATHIELSEDIAKEEVAALLKPLNQGFVRRPAPEKESIEKVVTLLQNAKRPLILAGNGAIRARVNKVLSQFVQKTNLPLVATFMGKGAISDQLPQSLLAMGLGFKDYVMQAVEKADCVFTIGYDIAEYSPEEWNPKADKKIIHLDFEAAEVYQH